MPFFDSRKPLKGNGEAFEGIAVVAIVHVDAHAGIKQHGAVRSLNQAADDLLEIIGAVRKRSVIANQRARWCGNPPDFQTSWP